MKAIIYILGYSILIIAGDDCRFPAHWHGLWRYQDYTSVKTLEITSDSINTTGKCVRSEGISKYLLSKPGFIRLGQPTTCYTCMIFTPRHVNVIQYKEGQICDNFENPVDMDTLCNQRGVGANERLKTLVRANATPFSCPINLFAYSISFTYATYDGFCEEDALRDSKMYQCASESKVKMVFSNCPKPTNGPEDGNYEFVCLATWISGGDWLYAKLGTDDYRCMYYDPTSKAFSISMNADCVGLSIPQSSPISISWLEGTQLYKPAPTCRYPSWFTSKEWLDLKGTYIYRFDQSAFQIVVDTRSTSETNHRFTCHQKDSSNRYIAEVIDDCDHGYQCITLQPITDSVARISIGLLSSTPATACSDKNTRPSVSDTMLVRDNGASPEACPVTGRYSLRTTEPRCAAVAEVPCNFRSMITLSTCRNTNQTFSCSASWSDGGVERLILSDNRPPYGSNCYRYENNGNEKIFTIDESCNYHSPPISPAIQDAQIKLFNRNRGCASEAGYAGVYNEESTNMAQTSTGCLLGVSHGLILLSSFLPVFLQKSCHSQLQYTLEKLANYL
ncbi:uncharacterized protein [Watersipora subatra]|uniref:uncharacterized protein n=1 Tax=Watersipora subatra TaxID=2589382 RepID=UPI00355B2426